MRVFRSHFRWLLLAFLLTRTALGFNVWIEPGLARFEDDFLLAAQQWEASGKLYPSWGPVLPGLLRAGLALGLSGDDLLFSVVLLWQVLLLTLILGLYHLLVQRIDAQVAFLATLCLTLDPSFATPSFLVATEVPYLFLLCCGVWAWQHFLSALGTDASHLAEGSTHWRGPLGWSLLSGVLLGAAALTRGNGLLVWAGLVGLTLAQGGWWVWRGSRRARVLLASGLVMAAAGLAPVLAWSAKNAHDYGHFSPTSSSDHNIAVLWIGPARAQVEGKPQAANLSIWADRMPMDGWTDPFARSAHAKSVALEWARAHPWEVAAAFVKGQLNTALGPGSALIHRFSPLPPLPLVIWTVLLRGLLWAGIVMVSLFSIINYLNIRSSSFIADSVRRLPWKPQGISGLWMLAVWGIVLAHVVPAGAGGYARFFFPALPFLYLTLALGLSPEAHAKGLKR